MKGNKRITVPKYLPLINELIIKINKTAIENNIVISCLDIYFLSKTVITFSNYLRNLLSKISLKSSIVIQVDGEACSTKEG